MMKNKIFKAEYAGHIIRFKFLCPETRYMFIPKLSSEESDCYDITTSYELLEEAKKYLPEGSRDAYIEYRVMLPLTSQELLKYDCCIFHAVSFIWENKAWLLTAPSGTGKTTQYLNWERLFPNEIKMISGDMPVLELKNDGTIWANPSSWNGKEDIGNQLSAPIAGIVILEQGEKNCISLLSAKDAVGTFFKQFIVRPVTDEQIYALARLIDRMLRSIPCFKMVNCGDDFSTALLRKTLSDVKEDNIGNLNETL